jgi:FkbM family methyltransferase
MRDWRYGSAMLEDDLVYDVGFHRGEDTAYYLRKGYRVVAFEANPNLVREGSRRFAGEISSSRLQIVEGAISNSDAQTIAFYQNPDTTVWGTTDTEWVERNRLNVQRISVPVVRFQDHLKRTGTPYFVKIDIEGSDLICLDALLTLDARPALLSIESEKKDIDKLQAELDMLEKIGFDRFAAVQQARMEERVIHTCTRDGNQFSYHFEPGSSGGFGDDINRWVSREEVERHYERIFRRYRLLGDYAAINRIRLGFRLRNEFSRLLRKPLPGWYDTHAARSYD